MDRKGLGYLISSVSVLLLGAVAWPETGEPKWKIVALTLGMGISVAGMFVRFLSHRKNRRDIEHAEAETRHADGKASR